jgi:uncharacterized protein YecE (DUF72 family)
VTIFVGTAGWSIPSAHATSFETEGSALERYASKFGAVEINSSFHRSHRPSTWARWADSVPANFRFSVKAPKTITHERKLADCDGIIDQFLEEIRSLGSKLAVILIQLPPKLEYDAGVASRFFRHLSRRTAARLACEPRHASWYEDVAGDFLSDAGVARVAADPALSAIAADPGGAPGLTYWRLHGSPRMYYSSYSEKRLREYAQLIAKEEQSGHEVWCMFDNTASSAALGDALHLTSLLAR